MHVAVRIDGAGPRDCVRPRCDLAVRACDRMALRIDLCRSAVVVHGRRHSFVVVMMMMMMMRVLPVVIVIIIILVLVAVVVLPFVPDVQLPLDLCL